MKNALAQIDCWLDAVSADRRLTANSVFKVARQLTRKINGNEFRKSGRLVTWQGIKTLAAATGLSERMVRYAVRELEAKGYLKIKTGRGPRQSNHYDLIEQKRQPVAAINSGNSGNPLPHSNQEVRQSSVSSAATGFRECGNPLPPNSSITHSITLPPTTDTEPGAPRRAMTALGALGEAADTAAFTGEVKCPLAILDAELRQRLGGNATWLDAARSVELADGVLTLSVLTVHQGDNIRRHCPPAILAAAGARELKFVIADPPKA